MVALDLVHASNAQLRELGPGLVALFVGGTSGIGEYTAKAFVKNAFSPRVYIVGRNETAAARIIQECKELNKDAKVDFLKADVSELAEVDRVCKVIAKRVQHINLIVQSQGNLNFRGRDESPEGLDRKFTLNYYSRMRFISNLLPELRSAAHVAPHFSRTLSILGAGHEGKVNLEDLELKNTFTSGRCAAHTTLMNDFMIEELAAGEPAISFIHSSPGIVNTGVSRELPVWARIPTKVLASTLLLPFSTSVEETGARQLFLATSALFPPAKPFEGETQASGVPVPWGLKPVATGATGKPGSGGYIAGSDNEIVGKQNIIKEYRDKGFGKTCWDHTMGIFARVEKINQERAAAAAEWEESK